MKFKTPGGAYYAPYLLDIVSGNHVLIAGTVGAGKSVLENSIIYALLATKYPGNVASGNGAQFVFIDPKRVELKCYKNLPHCLYYADNMRDIETVLKRVRAMIDIRLKEMQRRGLRKSNDCPVYVFIDEIIDIVTSPRGRDLVRIITDCISISRATNIFFIMLTQAPNRKILKPEIVLNCNCRIALRCNYEIESRQIIGDGAAVELPRHGVGIVVKDLDRYEIEIPFYSDAEINAIIKHWTRQHVIYNKICHYINRL